VQRGRGSKATVVGEMGDPGLDADELGGLKPFLDVFGMLLFIIFEETLRPDTNELVESIF